MGCLLALFGAFFPRLALFCIWIARPVLFDAALGSTFLAILGMLFLNRLPRLHHPLLKHRRFALATHDRFFVVIETADPKYSETETRKLLEAAGSKRIEMVED